MSFHDAQVIDPKIDSGPDLEASMIGRHFVLSRASEFLESIQSTSLLILVHFWNNSSSQLIVDESTKIAINDIEDV